MLGITNADKRSFYEIEATQQDWNLNHLRRQFDSGLYERLALSRDKDGIRQLASQGHAVARPEDLLKEPLVLEFLGLSEQSAHSESDLEAAVINQIGQFLLEPGEGFLFEDDALFNAPASSQRTAARPWTALPKRSAVNTPPRCGA